jgi:molecular chaperone DnaK (HSP70)
MASTAFSWLAIDFGTCYSSAAFLHDGHLERIEDPFHHQDSVPSSVYLRPDGTFVFGQAAERQKGMGEPSRYRSEFKRLLGDATPLVLGDQTFRPEELVTKLLAFLKGNAEEAAGRKLPEVVLTVPVSYEDHRRGLMRSAAKEAGFRKVELLEEPDAALLDLAARGGPSLAPKDLVVVYDLGGGTFDGALVRLGKGRHEVVAYRGDAAIGGANFDRAIERDFAAQAGDALATVLEGRTSDEPAKRRLALQTELTVRDFCRGVKHHLSVAESDEGGLPLAGGWVSYELTRARLRDLIGEELERTVALTRALVDESDGVSWKQVKGVLMVGGSCRMPIVRELLAELEVPRWPARDPELAVCDGAARRGAELRQPKKRPPPPVPPGREVSGQKRKPAANLRAERARLGLGAHTVTRLERAGIRTTAELATKTLEELTAIPGVGPRAIEEISAALASPGSRRKRQNKRIPQERVATWPRDELVLAAVVPLYWFAKGELTLLHTSGVAHIIASSEPIDPSFNSRQYAEAHKNDLHEFDGFRELSFRSAPAFGLRSGYVRQFEWQPPRESRVRQIQIYSAAQGRGYVATATTSSLQFAALEEVLTRTLDGFRLRGEIDPSDPSGRFQTPFTARVPSKWEVRESITLAAADGSITMIASSAPTTHRSAYSYADEVESSLRTLPGYRQLSFTPATVFLGNPGFIRRYEWKEVDGRLVRQAQAYFVTEGRAYGAMATRFPGRLESLFGGGDDQLLGLLSGFVVKKAH